MKGNMMQLSLGEVLKEEGIKASIDNANKTNFNWSNKAYLYLLDFVRDVKGTFMGEDIRNYAVSHGLDEPPSNRAWGSVIRKANRKGIIVFDSYDHVDNPVAHCANAARWKVGRL